VGDPSLETARRKVSIWGLTLIGNNTTRLALSKPSQKTGCFGFFLRDSFSLRDERSLIVIPFLLVVFCGLAIAFFLLYVLNEAQVIPPMGTGNAKPEVVLGDECRWRLLPRWITCWGTSSSG
jgi:hypothetical protein